jgi:hypothetical protein
MCLGRLQSERALLRVGGAELARVLGWLSRALLAGTLTGT